MVRPRLTSLDGGAKPDAAEKPRSAAMFDANSPTRPEPDPDPGWSTPPRPELPTEVGPDVRPEAALPDALAPDAVAPAAAAPDADGARVDPPAPPGARTADPGDAAPPFAPGVGPAAPDEDPGAAR